MRMQSMLALVAAAAALFVSGCSAQSGASSSPQSQQVHDDLKTIGSGYDQCVSAFGADGAQCKQLADGLHQVASTIDAAASTAGRIQMESQGRRSMGY